VLKMGKLTIPEVLKEKNGRVLWTKESLGFTPVQKVQKLFDDNLVQGKVVGVESWVKQSIVNWVCDKHNNHINTQTLTNIISGNGCKMCGNNKIAVSNSGKRRALVGAKMPEEYIEMLEKFLPNQFRFLGFDRNKWHNKLIVLQCLTCGLIVKKKQQQIEKRQRCKNCSDKKQTLPFDILVEKLKDRHNGIYEYPFLNEEHINSKSIISIICRTHGLFRQQLSRHLHKGNGCPKCSLSHGEIIVEQFLKENGYAYEIQKTFDNCRHKNPLEFDFYLPEFNSVIEYNGEQHYNFVKFFHRTKKGFEQQLLRDQIKRDFCKSNHIRLLELKSSYSKPLLLKTIAEFLSPSVCAS